MTAALEGVSGQQHAPAVLYPRKRPGTHCTGGCVGPRARLDGRKISPHRDFEKQHNKELKTKLRHKIYIQTPLEHVAANP